MCAGKQRRCESESHDGGCHYTSFVTGGVRYAIVWLKGEYRIYFQEKQETAESTRLAL